VIVLVPARLSAAEAQRWADLMVDRLAAQERRQTPTDDALAERAEKLATHYLGGRPRPRSVRWVTNQRSRWGSCTPIDGTIRLSTRLRTMPDWVVDYVLLHELAHLLHAGHGPRFWELLAGYPRLERARGYLEGVSASSSFGPFDADDEGALDTTPGTPTDPAFPPTAGTPNPSATTNRPPAARHTDGRDTTTEPEASLGDDQVALW